MKVKLIVSKKRQGDGEKVQWTIRSQLNWQKEFMLQVCSPYYHIFSTP